MHNCVYVYWHLIGHWACPSVSSVWKGLSVNGNIMYWFSSFCSGGCEPTPATCELTDGNFVLIELRIASAWLSRELLHILTHHNGIWLHICPSCHAESQTRAFFLSQDYEADIFFILLRRNRRKKDIPCAKRYKWVRTQTPRVLQFIPRSPVVPQELSQGVSWRSHDSPVLCSRLVPLQGFEGPACGYRTTGRKAWMGLFRSQSVHQMVSSQIWSWREFFILQLCL